MSMKRHDPTNHTPHIDHNCERSGSKWPRESDKNILESEKMIQRRGGLRTKPLSQSQANGHETESQQYEQDESEVWWHHQLQRFVSIFISSFSLKLISLLSRRVLLSFSVSLSGILKTKITGGHLVERLMQHVGFSH